MSTSRRIFICLFPGSRVTTDHRVVAKQEIQEVESAPVMSIVSDLENYLAWVEGASSAARVAALMYFDFDFNAQRQKKYFIT